VSCTTDSCNGSGRCTHTQVNAACSDGDPCNGVETCNVGSGCVAGTAPDCDDGDLCTQDDCDADLGCTNTYELATTCADAPAKAQPCWRQSGTSRVSFGGDADVAYVLEGTTPARIRPALRLLAPG